MKIVTATGREENFKRREVEDRLKAAGLSERLAEEVAERVEKKAENGWTEEKIREETDVELRGLQDDIDKAHANYKGAEPMGAYNVGETRIAKEGDSSANAQPRSETKVECKNVE